MVISVGNSVLLAKCPRRWRKNGVLLANCPEKTGGVGVGGWGGGGGGGRGNITLAVKWARGILKFMNWSKHRGTTAKRAMNPALYEELVFYGRKKLRIWY